MLFPPLPRCIMADDGPYPTQATFPSHSALMAAYLRVVDDLAAAELENDRYLRLLTRLSKSIARARKKGRKRRKAV